MTTYRAIASTETDPEAPITSTLMKALQQNVLAISESDSSAPSTLFPSVLLGTINTTSGTTQTLSGLTLTPYRHLLIYFEGVTTGISTTGVVTLSLASCATISSASGAALTAIRGKAIINLSSGVGDICVGSLSAAAPSSNTNIMSTILRTSLSTASTSISVSISWTGVATTFTAGSVLVYGVK